MKEAMRSPLCRAAVALALLAASTSAWSQTQSDEARSLEEVRNTVINLLETLARANPQLGTLVDLLNGPTAQQICPQSSQDPSGGG